MPIRTKLAYNISQDDVLSNSEIQDDIIHSCIFFPLHYVTHTGQLLILPGKLLYRRALLHALHPEDYTNYYKPYRFARALIKHKKVILDTDMFIELIKFLDTTGGSILGLLSEYEQDRFKRVAFDIINLAISQYPIRGSSSGITFHECLIVYSDIIQKTLPIEIIEKLQKSSE